MLWQETAVYLYDSVKDTVVIKFKYNKKDCQTVQLLTIAS